jgi:predicted transcriptional regulator
MDVVHRSGQATVAEVMAALPDSPSYSTVRALMGVLERKGHLKHRRDGLRYVYSPTQSRRAAGRSALRQILRTYFDSSTEKVVAALLDESASRISEEELDRLARRIDEARKQGR